MFPPFGVKILWFVLSLTGLLGCWAVSLALGRTVGLVWGWVLYCVGSTILHGIFCIGIAWKMDPYSMPSGFCTLQAVFVALGNFLVTGVVATLSYMTSLIIKKPKTWGERKHSAFKWQYLYLLPTAFFPIAATSIYIACVVKFNSVAPVRDFFCDSSTPQWVRFMSYAGMPMLLSIPSLLLSIRSLHQVLETTKHIKRARTGEVDLDPISESDSFTALPSRKRDFDRNSARPPNPSPSPSLQFVTTPPNREKRIPLVHFHFPIKPASSDSERDEDGRVASTSSLPREIPEFSPATPPQQSPDPLTFTNYIPGEEKEEWKSSLEITVETNGKRENVVWNDDGADSETHSALEGKGATEDGNISEEASIGRMRTHAKSFNDQAIPARTKRPPPCYLSPAIWRIIIFQITFIVVQVIGCLSTLVDVAARHSSPTPLGTHHFTMLFVVWGPVFAFGSLATVRQKLIPSWIANPRPKS